MDSLLLEVVESIDDFDLRPTQSVQLGDPKVFIDRWRQMPEGPPLLKERRYLRKNAAEQLWKSTAPGLEEDETTLGCNC